MAFSSGESVIWRTSARALGDAERRRMDRDIRWVVLEIALHHCIEVLL